MTLHKYRVTGTYFYSRYCECCDQPIEDGKRKGSEVVIFDPWGLTEYETRTEAISIAEEQLSAPGAGFQTMPEEPEVEDLGEETPEDEMRRIHAPMLPGFAEVAR